MRVRVNVGAFGMLLVVACSASSRETFREPAPTDVTSGGEPQRPAEKPSRDSSAIDEGNRAHGEAPALNPCAGRKTATGDFERTVLSASTGRHYRVSVPPNDGTKALPMLLSFHGLTEDSNVNRLSTRYDDLGRSKGFITVYMDGVDRSWNAGNCCIPATSSSVDDVRFVAETIASLSSELCVDERRVYASGFSNGGFLSYRLACELGDRIAAIGVVGATMAVTECNPARAVPIIHVHGSLDPVVPMPGNPALGFPSADDTIGGWVKRDECTSKPHETLRRGNGTCTTWDDCKNGASITYCTLSGTFHTWPQATFPATDVIWDFLEKQTL